jgi:putative oxidoreductase
MTVSLRRLMASDAPAAVLLIRFLVGVVFVSEGLQKFLFPAELGVGRFTKVALPSPEMLAPFVGSVEIVGGLLLLLGLCTRLAAVALIVDMLVAIATTKMPMLLKDGFWKMAYEARADWSMLLDALFLLLVGAGAWSLDALLSRTALGGSARERRHG